MNITRYTTPTCSQRSLGGARSFYSPLSDLLESAFTFSDLSTAKDRAWTPPVELHEDKDKYTIELELPGVASDAFNITLDEGVLTIDGERSQTRESKEGEYLRSERSYGKFKRQITLPAAVKSDEIQASYKDGVLHVEIPKAEEAKPRRIEVRTD